MPPSTTGCKLFIRPLTDAMRRLVQAGIRSRADEATIREAQTLVEAAVDKLGGTGEGEQVRLAVGQRPVVWGNPVTGFRNAIAPPLVMHEEPDGLWWSEFELGERTRGHRVGCTAASWRWCSTNFWARRRATG